MQVKNNFQTGVLQGLFLLEKRNQEIHGLSKALFGQSVIYKVLYKEMSIQQQYFIFQHVEEFWVFFVGLSEKLQGNTYRYTVTGLDDIRPLTPLLVQVISFNSSILFLVFLIQHLDTPCGTDSPPVTGQCREKLCHM